MNYKILIAVMVLLIPMAYADDQLKLKQFTIVAEFSANSDRWLVSRGDYSNDGKSINDLNYAIWLSDGKIYAGFEDSNGRNYVVGTTSRYNDGVKHVAILTYDMKYLKLYVDGKFIKSRSTKVVPDYNHDAMLVIDADVKIYNKALTEEEIKSNVSDGLVYVSNKTPIANDLNITIDEDNSVEIRLDAIDDDTLTYKIVEQPKNGVLSLNNDVAIYTPNTNYYGVDSFTYQAYDGSNYSNIARVSININDINDAPIANDDYYSIDEDSILSLDILANDYDVDSNLTYKIVEQPKNGIIEDDRYIPNTNYYGVDSFTYQAYDGSNYSNIARVSININDVIDVRIFNVKDYGAIGNGVNDDTQAVRNAIEDA
ncbi:MAG: Ig-like domain-containing protein, partial [Candidatus Nitrosocaldaceae archaeon]